MAIDLGFLGSILGGAATGFEARRERQEFERKSRLAEDKEAADQANIIYGNLVSLAQEDADDEGQTLQRLRNPALSPLAKQQEVEARQARFNQRRQIIDQLAARPGMSKYYGDVRGLVNPSRIGGEGFKMPEPEVNFDVLQRHVAEIWKQAQGAPAEAKPGIIQFGRQTAQQLGATPQFAESMLPMQGAEIGRIPGAEAPRPLTDPTKFFAQTPEFKMGVPGERKLPSGSYQKITYGGPDGKTPMVSYEKPVTMDYSNTEEKLAKIGKIESDINKTNTLLKYQVQQYLDKSERAKWDNLYAKTRALKADKLIDAQIKKLSGAGSEAANSLRRMSIMLAHQRGLASLGLRREQMDFQKNAAYRSEMEKLNNNIRRYQENYTKAFNAWGLAKSKGMSAAEVAARQTRDMYKAELDRLVSMQRGLTSGNPTTVQGVIDSVMSEMPDPESFEMMGVGMNPAAMAGMGMMGGYGMAQPQGPTNVYNIIPGGVPAAAAPSGPQKPVPVTTAPSPASLIEDLFFPKPKK